MPRGDGTGPHGTGPLNRSERGSGRGMGRRQNLSGPGNCRQNSGSGRIPLRNQEPSRAGGLLQGAVVKLLSMAVMAVPALLKARNRTRELENKVLVNAGSKEQPVIEIKPVHSYELEEPK